MQLYTSLPLLIEVDDALRRGTFQVRLQQAQVTADDLTLGFAALATTVEPVAVPPVILADRATMLQLPWHRLHRLKQSCRVMVIRFNWAPALQFQYCLLKY